MAIIIICMIIGMIIEYLSWDYDTGFYGFTGFVIGLILFFVVGGVIGEDLATKEIVEEQKIYALNDSLGVEGGYYLFSGYIDGDLEYRYVINTDKGKHIEEVDTDYGYIKEGDYEPKVEHHYYTFEKKWHKWFAHRLLVEDYYEFYVPENTVTTEYNVDLN